LLEFNFRPSAKKALIFRRSAILSAGLTALYRADALWRSVASVEDEIVRLSADEPAACAGSTQPELVIH
jgi:hypothetical protein